MYDELLDKIRQLLDYKGLMPVQVIMVYKELLGEAADAIEELSKQLDDMNEANIALYGALPKWIPVTERLPEPNKCDARGYAVPYLVMDGWMRVTARRTENYWVLFGAGTVLEHVTHWMPFPEPPMEK